MLESPSFFSGDECRFLDERGHEMIAKRIFVTIGSAIIFMLLSAIVTELFTFGGFLVLVAWFVFVLPRIWRKRREKPSSNASEFPSRNIVEKRGETSDPVSYSIKVDPSPDPEIPDDLTDLNYSRNSSDEKESRSRGFNLTWAINGMLLIVASVIGRMIGERDEFVEVLLGLVIVMAPICFTLSGIIGIPFRKKSEFSFGLKSQVYWVVLVLWTILSANGYKAIEEMAQESNNTSFFDPMDVAPSLIDPFDPDAFLKSTEPYSQSSMTVDEMLERDMTINDWLDEELDKSADSKYDDFFNEVARLNNYCIPRTGEGKLRFREWMSAPINESDTSLLLKNCPSSNRYILYNMTGFQIHALAFKNNDPRTAAALELIHKRNFPRFYQ